MTKLVIIITCYMTKLVIIICHMTKLVVIITCYMTKLVIITCYMTKLSNSSSDGKEAAKFFSTKRRFRVFNV